VQGDANGLADVFVRDRQLGTTVRASVSSQGAEADGASSLACLSADGRFVAFQSAAANLVAGDNNGVDDVFVRDLVAGTTLRASVSFSGGEGDQSSVAPAISGDGRTVAFVCLSEILIPGDSNLVRDVVVHDLVSGDLENLCLDSLAQQSDGMSLAVALDASGMRAVYQSYAENLVPNDTNGTPDVFLRLRGPFHAVSCPGDGSLPQACPCANSGAGGHGCANSAVAAGGVLEGEGGAPLDEVTLVARDLLPHALAIFLQGDSLSSGGLLFGDGLRCVSGALRRLYVAHAEFGVVSAPGPFDLGLRARAQALGDPLPPGSLRGYQVYYRDPDASFCPAPAGSTWNVTNAVSVQW
jgi:Tol biopolymer transport system component